MRIFLLILLSVIIFAAFADLTMAQDGGVPDTLYVEKYPLDDTLYQPGPFFVRFPIYVTNDIVDPELDSIAGFVLPLCYNYTEYGQVNYCRATAEYNNTACAWGLPLEVKEKSIFRHLPSMSDPQILHPWMEKTDDFLLAEEIWDYREITLDGSSTWWVSLVPTSSKDMKWEGGSRVLLATMTFEVDLEDSLLLCIDSCFWFPSSRLAFSNAEAETYIPGHFLPKCGTVKVWFWLPPVINCPGNRVHNSNGHFVAVGVSGYHAVGTIQAIQASFSGTGVENVMLINVTGLGTAVITADVAYDVVDHCQAGGGTVLVTVTDDIGVVGTCEFEIWLYNNSPSIAAPDTFTTLSDYGTGGFWVTATDPDGDSIVSFSMDGFWCESDSLRPPTNEPTFDGKNPGKFLWNPQEADTGAWIALFSVEDECGAVDVEDVVVRVSNVLCGDVTDDMVINLGDAVYLLSYLYKGGDTPDPLCQGNVNCDDAVDLSDIIYLLNRLFKGGSACCFDCCTGW